LLLLPAIIYLVAMTRAPFVLTLWYSVHTWILTEPNLGQGFVGLENYTYTVLQDTIFRDAVVNTLLITAGIVGVSLLLVGHATNKPGMLCRPAERDPASENAALIAG